jgi:hypothetical protein
LDLTQSIAPKSDQLNADDLISGPITVTIRGVAGGSEEQPVDVHLVEFPGRAYRPSKSMRRVLVMAWGAKGAAYVGQRLTLVRNPEITFGREKVGGIEIAAMSGIGKPLTVALTATRGRRRSFTVQPLPDAPTLAPGEIPELVATNAAKAAANGTTDEYLAYLTEQGAPAYILEFVTNSKEA